MIDFDQSSVTAQPGQFSIVRGQRRAFNSLNCPSRNNAVDLNHAATMTRQIFQIVRDSIGSLPLRFDQQKGHRNVRQRTLNRLTTQLNSYFSASRLVMNGSRVPANATERNIMRHLQSP